MLASLPARLALAPVLIAQGLRVRARARVLPEAAGPREGTTGQGEPLRLLIAGDSSAAGVGCAHQDEALSGRLVATLAPHRQVIWRLEAASGATTRDMIARLSALAPEPFDIAVIALGVNDTARMVPARLWSLRVQTLNAVLRGRFGVGRMIWSGVPPMGDFPLLPQPLAAVLGALAARNDALLAKAAEGLPGFEHLKLALPLTPDLMAEDGYHPNPAACRLWAEMIAGQILGQGPGRDQ
jgi:lysophospholipase L1-like esterase